MRNFERTHSRPARPIVRKISTRLCVGLFALLVSSIPNTRAQDKPLYLDKSKPIEARVEDLMSRLTVEEEIGMVHAKSTFAVAGAPELGVPDLWMDDGPMGVREEVGEGFRNMSRADDAATALPATLGLAATFDTNLARAYGTVIGQEAHRRGKNIMLGPSLNIQRTPLCGRNFEYLGEDPFLTSRMAVNYIEGVQAEGVGSCAKHFAANNQENGRGSVNVLMDERTLREIYLPAFRAAVQEGGVLSVMGAYNLFRGQHCCENDYLLNDVLKKEWGFKGLVMSDWGGVHNTDLAVRNGMDMEMGSRPPYASNYLAAPFAYGLDHGRYPMSMLDDKVRRHLYVMFKLDLIRDPNEPSNAPVEAEGPLSTAEHQDAARRIAESSIVLLKNKDLLPLDSSRIKSIAVIGANAAAEFAHGGGSANIKCPFEITALQGISNRAGANIRITYAPGYVAPAGRGSRRGNGTNSPAATNSSNLVADAVATAKAADVVIFVGGLNHNGGYDAEGVDRPDLRLPGGQDELLEKIVAANPRTIVVFMGGGAVEMGSWLEKTPSVLYAWYGGMEAGNALARVLFGDVNPCGKLPCTFPKRLADSPAHALGAYPGTNDTVTYVEGLLVGYRWFDAKNIEPLFPFGHGLSYTSFKYSGLKLTPDGDAKNPAFTVEFELANAGKREGAEVAEVYVQEAHPSVTRPDKELKGFAKVLLKPGEKQIVSVRLDQSAFSHYDPDRKGWVADQGGFNIIVGSSSRDVRLRGSCRLDETAFLAD